MQHCFIFGQGRNGTVGCSMAGKMLGTVKTKTTRNGRCVTEYGTEWEAFVGGVV